jgi:hypothetical protein
MPKFLQVCVCNYGGQRSLFFPQQLGITSKAFTKNVRKVVESGEMHQSFPPNGQLNGRRAAALVLRKFDGVTCRVSGVFDTHEYVGYMYMSSMYWAGCKTHMKAKHGNGKYAGLAVPVSHT